MTDFYPIPEAASHTRKSVTTIRRFIRSIVASDQHPDRDHVLPLPDEVRRMRKVGEQFAWTIDVELLNREFPLDKGLKATANVSDSLSEIVALLRTQLQDNREQLKVKDSQIASQVEIIHSLNERLHEGNVLIGTLQKQSALPEAPAAKPTTPKAPAPVKQSAPKRPARKGLFARLFR